MSANVVMPSWELICRYFLTSAVTASAINDNKPSVITRRHSSRQATPERLHALCEHRTYPQRALGRHQALQGRYSDSFRQLGLLNSEERLGVGTGEGRHPPDSSNRCNDVPSGSSSSRLCIAKSLKQLMCNQCKQAL